MGERLDDLLGELASGDASGAPGDVEAEVWRRVDARDAGRSRLKSSVGLQCAIATCALLIGFSYQACQRAAFQPAPRDSEPSLRLLDGSMVAEAGTFQVLR